jgi:hypothetical protein
MQYEKTKLTYGEIEGAGNTVISIIKTFTQTETLNTLKVATFLFDSAIGKFYNYYMKSSSDLLVKYVEVNEDGSPKMKVPIIGINEKEKPQQDFLWKSDDAKKLFQTELAELANTEVEVSLPKFNLADLLECKPKIGDSYHLIIKYIS